MSAIQRSTSYGSHLNSHSNHHESHPVAAFGHHPQFERFDSDAEDDGLERHLSLFDLTSIGVGGTVGSGIFVLTGQIAHEYSGPATFISWILAGFAAFTSGLAFAELAARIPHSGSTYAYARLAGGKQAAVVAAACLTLEYMISGSAVARTWGDKVLVWLERSAPDSFLLVLMKPVEWMNVPASLISFASTLLLLGGVRESKLVTNLITAVKMLVVGLMVVGGFLLFHPVNMQPPLAPFGVNGVLRGATSSFFGYLGYDEICVVAGEAKHPRRDLPRAVLGTLVIVTVCYVLGAIALTGMLPYTEISPTSGFPEAFASRGWGWASQVTALGEVGTLPVVVLISLLAQPRLTFAMAKDGILPRAIFAPTNSHGQSTLFNGTLISGIIMTVTAAFVPFTYLDDLISSGILLAFCMTNSALIQFRCTSSNISKAGLQRSLLVYHILCFLTALSWNTEQSTLWTLVASICTLCWLICLIYICRVFPGLSGFAGLPHDPSCEDTGEGHHEGEFFVTPMVPLLPCLGIAMNWYLVAQLEFLGLMLLALYLATCLLLFRIFCEDDHEYERVCPASAFTGVDGLGSPAGIGMGQVLRRSASSASQQELRSIS
eukprot:scaffold4961_cov149-Amphora_coffeaeformis.AAC.1